MVTVAEKGFKRTEVGMIPDDWDSTKSLNNLLSEMTDFVAAGSFESLRENVSVYDFDNYAFYIRLVDIRAGIGHINQKYVDKKSYDFLKRSNLFGGEILIANIGANVGEVFLMPKVNKPSTIAPNMILMRTNESIINSSFCYYFINSKTGQKLLSELISGSGHPKLNKTDLKKLLIPLPPTIEEQKSIATALTDVDELITGLEKLISKKKDIKQGAMQQLLTPPHKGGKQLPGFSGDWVEKTLGEIINLDKGEQLNKDTLSSDGEYPVINGGVEPSGYCEKWNRSENTITISEGGNSCGFVNLLKTKFWSGGHCYSLKLKTSEVNQQYLYLFLKHMENSIMSLRVGSGLPNIQKGRLLLFNCSFPNDIIEQKAIAQILSDIDAEITQLETKKEKYQNIKQGMMQELLTGKTRLV